MSLSDEELWKNLSIFKIIFIYFDLNCKISDLSLREKSCKDDFNEVCELLSEKDIFSSADAPICIVQENIRLATVRFARLCGFAKMERHAWFFKETSSIPGIEDIMKQKLYKNIWWRILKSSRTFCYSNYNFEYVFAIMKNYYGIGEREENGVKNFNSFSVKGFTNVLPNDEQELEERIRLLRT